MGTTMMALCSTLAKDTGIMGEHNLTIDVYPTENPGGGGVDA